MLILINTKAKEQAYKNVMENLSSPHFGYVKMAIKPYLLVQSVITLSNLIVKMDLMRTRPGAKVTKIGT